MPNHLIFPANRKRTLIYAIAAVVLSISLAPGARAQATATPTATATTWTINVDATGQGPTPAYAISSPSSAPKTCSKTNPTQPSTGNVLYVCAGDTVQWTATTSKMNGHVYLYHVDPVLNDSSGATAHGFEGLAGQPINGIVKPTAALGQHEYYVAVFDSDAHRLYVEDPKIIIGTGNKNGTISDLVNSIQPQAVQLRDLVNGDPTASRRAKEQAEKLVRDVQKLKEILQVQ